MSDDPDSYSQAEIVRLLTSLSANVDGLRAEVHALGSTFVTRAELNAWQTAYDREIKDLKEATRPNKVSGWTIAAVIVSGVVGVGALLTTAITLITQLN